MIRLTLPSVLILLANQAAAHAGHAPHVHSSSPLSLVVIGLLGLVLIGFTIGTAALIRTRAKGSVK